ncbi:MAG: glycosyltransferase family 2 protein [Luteolibacter sp.]|jgi:4,4'-diaponeurosporenoate glycosyltransferase|nr:glycosyltransferase family 2 protein [Luteolibacter sp.]
MIYVFTVLWLAGWVLAYRFRRPLPAAIPGNLIEPSIIIPARNEAHNLPKLLDSLNCQPVKPREILVVDDGSTDRTAEIASGMGARVIASQPLPPGWRGKTWACHQGALAANGDWLLFMDADTWFKPGGLERVLSPEHPGALSVVPYHSVRKPYEDLSLFFNVCMTAGTVPDGLAGQFLLVRRDHYQLAGGHESVHGRVLENFRLAEHLRDAGVPLRSLTGKGILSFSMYPEGFRDMIQGWTKGFAAGAGGTSRGTLMLVIAWMIGLMIAPLAGCITGDWLTWGIACGSCSLQVVWIGRKLGSFGWWLMLLYPLPLLFFFGLFGWSAIRSGRKVTWKGREIHAD